jgi:hypothetical protein
MGTGWGREGEGRGGKGPYTLGVEERSSRGGSTVAGMDRMGVL